MSFAFLEPWDMMPLENVSDWIDVLKEFTGVSDPLYGKEIFVSGIHGSKTLLLIENETDDNYAIVSIEKNHKKKGFVFRTIEIINSEKELNTKIKIDHEKWLEQFV